MTNLLNLPRFPAGATITISSNSDWKDSIYVAQPGAGDAVSLTGVLATSGPHLSGLASPPPVSAGWIVKGLGIPDGTTVASATSNSVTFSAAPTAASPAETIFFYPPPLDLTGISFSSMLRASAADPSIILTMSTALGTMTNGGASGLFGWNVPAAKIASAPFGASLARQGLISCVLDVIATDATGATVNLCEVSGAIPVSISLSVTR